MAVEDGYESASEFLQKMDSGELDGNLMGEVGQLTEEQRDELVQLLLEREAGKSN